MLKWHHLEQIRVIIMCVKLHVRVQGIPSSTRLTVSRCNSVQLHIDLKCCNTPADDCSLCTTGCVQRRNFVFACKLCYCIKCVLISVNPLNVLFLQLLKTELCISLNLPGMLLMPWRAMSSFGLVVDVACKVAARWCLECLYAEFGQHGKQVFKYIGLYVLIGNP